MNMYDQRAKANSITEVMNGKMVQSARLATEERACEPSSFNLKCEMKKCGLVPCHNTTTPHNASRGVFTPREP